MMHAHPLIASAFASVLLLSTSCNKDELTVISTANTHACEVVVVQLDIDSLVQLAQPEPDEADVYITICACDTLVIEPVNLPSDLEFEYWVIDQSEEIQWTEDLLLDTITVHSELWFHYDQPGPYHMLRVNVDVENCE
jgi:hypothetical protein